VTIIASTSIAEEIDDALLTPWRAEGDAPIDVTSADTSIVSEKFGVRFLTRWYYAEPATSITQTSPLRIGQKFKFQDKTGLTLLLATEKDPGESNLLDHTILSAELPIDRLSSQLILGNYLVRSGHGLLVNTSRNYGLGTWSDYLLRFPIEVCTISDTWQEETALYGAAFQTKIKWLESSFWVSSRQRDASLDSSNVITGFKTTGYHRTASEKETQDNVEENTIGGRLGVLLFKERLILGTTWQRIKWDKLFLYQGMLYDESWGYSCDLSYSKSPFALTFETAADRNSILAFAGSIKLSQDKVACQFFAYHVPYNYFAPAAQTLEFNAGDVYNRQGGYAVIDYKFSSRIQINGYLHLYHFIERQESQSTGGRDYFLTLTSRINGQLSASLTSHWMEHDLYDAAINSRWRGSSAVIFTSSEGLTIKSRVDLAVGENSAELGRSGQIRLKYAYQVNSQIDLRIQAGVGFYSTDSYETRLFWAEQDLSRVIDFHPVWGDGKLFELSSQLNLEKFGELQFKSLWDQPNAGFDRNPFRSFRVIYQWKFE